MDLHAAYITTSCHGKNAGVLIRLESKVQTITCSYHLQKLTSNCSAWSSLSHQIISAERTACLPTLNMVLFSSSRKTVSNYS